MITQSDGEMIEGRSMSENQKNRRQTRNDLATSSRKALFIPEGIFTGQLIRYSAIEALIRVLGIDVRNCCGDFHIFRYKNRLDRRAVGCIVVDIANSDSQRCISSLWRTPTIGSDYLQELFNNISFLSSHQNLIEIARFSI